MFTMALTQSGTVGPLEQVREYDDEYDNVVSLLSDACAGLDDSGNVQFVVSGFGFPWPVDVRTDLAVAIGQVPHALRALAAGSAATIDFYEQGIERVVTMTVLGDQVELACRARTTRQPSQPLDHAARVDVTQMLDRFLQTFVNMVEMLSPQLRRHPWFTAWLGT